MRAALAVAVVVLVGVATACVGTTPTGQLVRGDAPRRPPDDALVPGTVRASNDFAVDLYRSADQRSNVVHAPYSILSALAMSRAGSVGATRDQFDAVLHADETENLDEGINAVDQLLESRSGERSSSNRKGRVTPSFDASVWGQRGTRFTRTYLDTLSSDHDSPMRVVDFRSDDDAAREAINQWGSDATQERITEVVPRGDVTAFTRFLPVAVAYLRAPWLVPFDRAATRAGRFVQLDGDTIEAQTMQVSSPTGIRTASSLDWDAVELPYLGDQLSLLIVAPRSGTFETFRQGLDMATIRRVSDRLEDDPVDLRLPMFQFTTSGDLTNELKALGLGRAFTRDADFSGITTDEVLSLSGVAYQGYAAINEEGTDAERTATAPPPSGETPPKIKLAIDRPFVFAVRDRETGLILMLGQVVDPS